MPSFAMPICAMVICAMVIFWNPIFCNTIFAMPYLQCHLWQCTSFCEVQMQHLCKNSQKVILHIRFTSFNCKNITLRTNTKPYTVLEYKNISFIGPLIHLIFQLDYNILNYCSPATTASTSTWRETSATAATPPDLTSTRST
jgi:hypothetical protein